MGRARKDEHRGYQEQSPRCEGPQPEEGGVSDGGRGAVLAAVSCKVPCGPSGMVLA